MKIWPGGLKVTDCLVVGKPNVGKTCFVINFAAYMGLKKLKFYIKQPAGFTSTKSYSINIARNKLISTEANYTRNIQAVKLTLPIGKVDKELKIVDSCGLREGIHPDAKIRMAMATTIKHLQNSKLILHIIDLTNISRNTDDILPSIDRMIVNFASIDKNYAIIVNKIDLKEYIDNLTLIKKKLTNKVIIPISALYQKGLEEIKTFVLKYV